MATIKQSNPSSLTILNARLKELDGKDARAGWFESAKYPDGTPVAYVAAIHEFGSPVNNIPPRPFMRPAVAENTPEWRDLMAQGARALLKGTRTLTDVMNMIGTRAAGDIAKAIEAVDSPPLKPATIARKGFSKPLVETGLMLQTVSHTVEDSK